MIQVKVRLSCLSHQMAPFADRSKHTGREGLDTASVVGRKGAAVALCVAPSRRTHPAPLTSSKPPSQNKRNVRRVVARTIPGIMPVSLGLTSPPLTANVSFGLAVPEALSPSQLPIFQTLFLNASLIGHPKKATGCTATTKIGRAHV